MLIREENAHVTGSQHHFGHYATVHAMPLGNEPFTRPCQGVRFNRNLKANQPCEMQVLPTARKRHRTLSDNSAGEDKRAVQQTKLTLATLLTRALSPMVRMCTPVHCAVGFKDAPTGLFH